jgi:hypothetical protein
MKRISAATVLLLAGAAVHAGPVSQWGGTGLGLLLIPQEPQVDVLAVRVGVDAAWDGAAVTVDYVLHGPPTEREVQVYVGAAVRLTERDGEGPQPLPWRDATLWVDGAPVPAGNWEENPARAEFECLEGSGPVRAQWLRARLRMKAGKTVTLQARFKVPLTHDDWVSPDGKNVEQGPRTLCVRARPVGVRGRTAGLFSARVTAPPEVVVQGNATEVVMDLALVPDVRITWPPAAAPLRSP